MTGPQTIAPMDMARLKIELLAGGLRLPEATREALKHRGKPPLRVRSGSCGGLDLILPDRTYVNCPVLEPFAAASSLRLVERDGDMFIEDAAKEVDVLVDLVPAPEYYGRRSSGGTLLSRVGQLCFDRIGVGLTNRCVYWESRDARCKFCSIGLNLGAEGRDKDLDDILAAVGAAYDDPVSPARHLLLGGGTPEGPDAGATRIASAAAAIKTRWPDRPIYAMIAPPADLAYLAMLRDAGVDELGMNVELFTDEAAARFIPGKHREIGLDGYFRALECAVHLFGPVNTRSITVVGLEPIDATVWGVAQLAKRGVMPILSPFRPLAGTEMEHHPRMPAHQMWAVAERATEAAGAEGMPLGPTCIPCQGNTVNLPGHPAYRFY